MSNITEDETTALFFKWVGVIGRNREAFATRYDVFALGCPEFLIDEMCKIYMIE